MVLPPIIIGLGRILAGMALKKAFKSGMKSLSEGDADESSPRSTRSVLGGALNGMVKGDEDSSDESSFEAASPPKVKHAKRVSANVNMSSEELLATAVDHLEAIDDNIKAKLVYDEQSDRLNAAAHREETIESGGKKFNPFGIRGKDSDSDGEDVGREEEKKESSFFGKMMKTIAKIALAYGAFVAVTTNLDFLDFDIGKALGDLNPMTWFGDDKDAEKTTPNVESVLSNGTSSKQALKNTIRGIESGTDDSAKNPKSTATGRYQFLESTWLGYFDNRFPNSKLNKSEKLALRTDPKMNEILMDDFIADNERSLIKAGHKATSENLYLAHFAGASGANSVLGADRSTRVENILKPAAMKANPHLKDMTAGDMINWSKDKVRSHQSIDADADKTGVYAGTDIPSESPDEAKDDEKTLNHGSTVLGSVVEFITKVNRDQDSLYMSEKPETPGFEKYLQLYQSNIEMENNAISGMRGNKAKDSSAAVDLSPSQLALSKINGGTIDVINPNYDTKSNDVVSSYLTNFGFA